LTTQAITQLSDRVSGISARIYPPVVSGGDNIVATEVEGLILGIPAEEWRLAAYHLFRGAPEVGLARALENVIRPGMVVVDVGANIGLFTLISARCVGYGGRVISFEPSPRIFALLRDNIQVNGWLETGVIDVRQTALSDFTGAANFNVFPATSGHSNLFGGPPDCQRIEVETDTLDHALSAIPKVDVIKIDAEGAEPFILRGMRETLKRNPRLRLFIEFAPAHLERAGVDPSSFLDELISSGFEIHTVDDRTGELKTQSKDELLRQLSVNLSLNLRERISSATR
jgi:FkbM family methyltransferase